MCLGAKGMSKKVTVEEAENTTKDTVNGNSLVVQGLGFKAFTAWAQVQFLVRELRSCKLCSEAKKKKKNDTVKKSVFGTSLVVQYVRLCTSKAGGLGSIPGQRTSSHMLQLRVCMPKLRPDAVK